MSFENPSLRLPLIEKDVTIDQVTEEVCTHLDQRPSRSWWGAFGFAFVVLCIGMGMVTYQLRTGIGVWGLNKTIDWGFDITNFVFWVGIGHAGTLISAVLLLFRQKWRTSINRSAEAMTIFAVMCAAIFPIIHMGRPWLALWVLPYPNTRGSLWVNFRSALLWDVFAISTYFTISLVFWYVGMIPDLATMRDRVAAGWRKKFYGFLSLGWNGSHRAWSRHETLCWILAGLATPLVISVHSIVSMDFATALIPGWHTTIFPPYYVAGAVFSGFAMVMTLLVITRKVMHFEHYITVGHLDSMAKIILLTGSIVGLAYLTELFIAWYSGNIYEWYTFRNRMTGPYGKAYAIMILCNVLTPQLFWFKRMRTSVPVLFTVSILVNIGMWFERFVIIVVSLHRDFLPSSWAMYRPTIIEFGTLIGTFGFFFCCFLLFVRFIPAIAINEVKGIIKYVPKGPAGGHDGR